MFVHVCGVVTAGTENQFIVVVVGFLTLGHIIEWLARNKCDFAISHHDKNSFTYIHFDKISLYVYAFSVAIFDNCIIIWHLTSHSIYTIHILIKRKHKFAPNPFCSQEANRLKCDRLCVYSQVWWFMCVWWWRHTRTKNRGSTSDKVWTCENDDWWTPSCA